MTADDSSWQDLTVSAGLNRADLGDWGVTRVTASGSPGVADVLILQHGDELVSAQLLDVLVEQGIEPAVRSVTCAADLPDPGGAHAAILVGPHSAEEAAAAGYLSAEVDWVRRADRAGATLLGLGHGARVLALAFGGLLSTAQRPLRGWAMVDTEIPHVLAAGPWLTWQHDVIALPAACRVLARNRLGPQAFRFGRHVGIQFHPEATPRVMARWAARDPDLADPDALLHTTARDAVAAAFCTRRLLSTFTTAI